MILKSSLCSFKPFHYISFVPSIFFYPTSPICSFFPPILLLHPFHTSLPNLSHLFPLSCLSISAYSIHSFTPFQLSLSSDPSISSHLFLPSHHICPCHLTFSYHLMHSLNPTNVSINTKGFPSFNSAAMSLNLKGRGKEIQRVVKH